MANLASVQSALDMLERVQGELAGIATRSDDDRKQALIDLRRQLALTIIEVGRVAEPVITTAGDPELLRTFRVKLSRMRSAAAIHQADWPAVRLGEKPNEYSISARAVRDANQQFVTWIRDALAEMR